MTRAAMGALPNVRSASIPDSVPRALTRATLRYRVTSDDTYTDAPEVTAYLDGVRVRGSEP